MNPWPAWRSEARPCPWSRRRWLRRRSRTDLVWLSLDSRRTAVTVRHSNRPLRLAGQVGPTRIHKIPTPECLPPDQHAEAHLVAPSQGDLDVMNVRTDAQARSDHGSAITLPTRTPNRSTIGDGRLHRVGVGTRALPRVDREPDPRDPIPLEVLQVECMERRGAGAGVDLGLDPRSREIGKPDPFPPTDGVEHRCLPVGGHLSRTAGDGARRRGPPERRPRCDGSCPVWRRAPRRSS